MKQFSHFFQMGCKETFQRVYLSAQPYLAKNDCSLLLVTMLRRYYGNQAAQKGGGNVDAA